MHEDAALTWLAGSRQLRSCHHHACLGACMTCGLGVCCMLCRLWKFPITADTEAAVAALPAFDFDPTGPCMEECSSCCLPGSLSPSVEGTPQPTCTTVTLPRLCSLQPLATVTIATPAAPTGRGGAMQRVPCRHSSHSLNPTPSVLYFLCCRDLQADHAGRLHLLQ